MVTPKTTPSVTEEQLARCQRITDETTGETFYKVDSESDPTTDYTVKALRKNGKTYLTCTCPAGSQGAPRCKHRIWAAEHARRFHQEQAELEAKRHHMAVLDRYQFPRSSTEVFTVQHGELCYEVIRYANGQLACECQTFWNGSSGQLHCPHTDYVQQHLQQVLEETARYLHEVAAARVKPAVSHVGTITEDGHGFDAKVLASNARTSLHVGRFQTFEEAKAATESRYARLTRVSPYLFQKEATAC